MHTCMYADSQPPYFLLCPPAVVRVPTSVGTNNATLDFVQPVADDNFYYGYHPQVGCSSILPPYPRFISTFC